MYIEKTYTLKQIFTDYINSNGPTQESNPIPQARQSRTLLRTVTAVNRLSQIGHATLLKHESVA